VPIVEGRVRESANCRCGPGGAKPASAAGRSLTLRSPRGSILLQTRVGWRSPRSSLPEGIA
jgi:hypothetical protein